MAKNTIVSSQLSLALRDIVYLRIMKRFPISLLLLFSFWTVSTLAQTYTPGQVYWGTNNYVEYRAGDLPIIISAPHGGYLEPASIPDRTCANCVTGRDLYTLEIAQELDSAIYQQFGRRAHIIISQLGRKKLDPNREIVEAAQGNPEAEQAWHEFHAFIQTARDTVEAHYPRGFYIDLHAHGHSIQRLELGYLLTSIELRLSDAALDNMADESSLHELADSLASKVSFSDLLRGPSSMGGLLEEYGYPAVPSPSDTAPMVGEPYFIGGYNTRRHASRDSGRISGLQIECNYDGVRDSRAHRERFARSLSCAIDRFIDTFYTAPPPRAAGVTILTDGGAGSLRDAIDRSRAGDTVRLDGLLAGDTLQLSQDRELCLCHDLVIEGGSTPAVIHANNNSRAFGMAPLQRIYLKKLHLMAGKTNSRRDGGAIMNEGVLTVEDCRLYDNESGDDGGGIACSDTATLEVYNTTFDRNTANDDGGGIHTLGPSTVVNASSFYQNTAVGNGGGMRLSDGQVHLTNATLVENLAGNRGGGVSSIATIQLTHCTLVDNQSGSLGGGLRVPSDTARLSNCLFTGNTGSSEEELSLGTSGAIISLGYNLVSDSTGGEMVATTGDLLGNAGAPQTAGIGPYAAYGGPTNTVALLPLSPAIDAGMSSLVTDQRGVSRPVGSAPDIGAYEWEIPLGIGEEDWEKGSAVEGVFEVYPNPFEQIIHLDAYADLTTVSDIRLMDALGRTVISWEGPFLTSNIRLDIPANLPSGNYVLVFVAGERMYRVKMAH